MTLQQIEYVVNLAKTQNFTKAAELSFISQPALTIQIKNFEDELGVQIFNRNTKPIEITQIGKQIIEQCNLILERKEKIYDLVSENDDNFSGDFRIGIIPTIAPYLVPLFISKFVATFRDLNVIIDEDITENIIKKLLLGEIHVGIFVIPVKENRLIYHHLFYEKFYAFLSQNHPLSANISLKISEINLDELWLLKEGNCFRNQIINICTSHKTKRKNFHYESTSIDSIIRIIEKNEGITIIPELAIPFLNENQKKNVREIGESSPVRNVNLVVNQTFLRKKIITELQKIIVQNLPTNILLNTNSGEINTNL